MNLSDRKKEELIETLCDLKHDLGKYIKLPVALLPRDAADAEFAGAVVRAVRETRKGPRGVTSAGKLFQAFDADWGDALAESAAYASLRSALERAVAWADRAEEAAATLPRAEVTADLSGVSAAIAALLSEVEGD